MRRARLLLWFPFVAASLTILLAIAVLLGVDHQARKRQEIAERATVASKLDTVRARLEHDLNEPLVLSRGLVAYIVAHGDITRAEFDRLAAVLLNGPRRDRRLSLSRGTVIEMTYPLEGNQAVIGVDYRALPKQWPSVEQAIRTRDPVLNGPVPLIQGGTGLIVRAPVYVPSRNGDDDAFFGIASVGINMEGVFARAGLGTSELPIFVAIRGKDGKGEDGEMILGDEALFVQAPVLADVHLPYGIWRLAAVPKGGWSAVGGSEVQSLRIMGGCLVLLVALSAFGAALYQRQRLLAEFAKRQSLEAAVEARTAELADFLRAVDAHAIVSMADADGTITYANDQFCESSGYSREELLGNNHSMVRSGRHDEAYYDDMWTTLLQGGVWQGTICNRSKDGTEYWVRSTIAPTSVSGEQSQHRFISIRTDITDVINDRERLVALSRELGLFKKIIESTTDAVGVTDTELRFIYTNPATDRLHQQKLVEHHFSEVIPPSGASVLKAIRRAIDTGKGWTGQLPLRRADGTTFISASNIGVVTDDEGRVQYAFNIFHDFTSELVRRMELDNARHAAEMANRAKSDFLSGMSHELRTPLNAVLGFAEVLLAGYDTPLTDKQRGYVDHIMAGGSHLLELINEVLDLSKVEAGGLALDMTTIQLRSVIDECLSLSTPMFAKYEVTPVDETTDCDATVSADPLRARQLVLNLLSNAAKYNRPSGTVTLSCENLADGFHRLTIADTGKGIPEHKHDQMFKAFSRLGAEATSVEGTGIGLVLSKSIVEAMGGRIGFSSVVDQGSRFWLDFPLSADKVQPPATATKVSSSLHYCAEDRLVLYIEDNAANRSLMETLFEQLTPMRLITTTSAEDGLALARGNQPDVILLDINLPGMNGFEAIAQLKEDATLRHIPVVGLSADATGATIERALKSGFADYLTKPVQLAGLVRTLSRVMETKYAGHD